MTFVDGVDFTETLSPRQVARLFRVDVRTVAQWADAGRLSCIRIPPRNHRRYSRAQVDELLAALRGPGPLGDHPDRSPDPAHTTPPRSGPAIPPDTTAPGSRRAPRAVAIIRDDGKEPVSESTQRR